MWLPTIEGWVVYATSAAGFLFLCLVLANLWKAYETRLLRKSAERIERFLKERF